MSAVSEWFVRRGKEVRGPFNSDQLRELARTGKIRRDDRVRQGHDGAWTDAVSVRGLFVASDDGQPVLAGIAPAIGVGYDPLSADLSRAVGDAMKNCPFCGEAILQRAIKCKHCGEFLDKPRADREAGERRRAKPKKQTTDIFAVLCFSTGMLSLVILPIVFAPACYITGIISYFRLKDNPELKGRWLRLVGAIAGVISILWLLVQFELLRLPALGELMPGGGESTVGPESAVVRSQPEARMSHPNAAASVTPERGPEDWAADLKRDDAEVRRAAGDALVAIGEPAVDVVVRLLNEDGLRTRRLAIEILGRIGPGAETAVPALIRFLVVPDMRMQALDTLGKIGRGANAAVPTIIVEFENAVDDQAVSAALANIDSGAAEQFKRLVFLNSQIKVLESKADLADAEKEAIGLTPAEFGRRAKKAIAIKQEILEAMEERKNIVVSYLDIISSGKPFEPVSAQGPYLEGHPIDYWVDLIETDSFSAENAIKKIGPQAVPWLVKRLPQSSDPVRLTILYLLGGFGPKGLPAVEAVSKLLADASQPREVRLWSARALYQFGPMAADAVPSLVAGIHDSDADVRRACCLAVAQIDPGRTEWLDALLADIATPNANSEARCAALQALAETGAARGAESRLLPILRDPDAAVRSSVAEVLNKIDPGWQSRLPPPTDDEVDAAARSVFIAAIEHRVALCGKLARECAKLWRNTSDGKMRAASQRATVASIQECAPDALLSETASLITYIRGLEKAMRQRGSTPIERSPLSDALDAAEELLACARAIYSATLPGMDQREYLIPDAVAESVKGQSKNVAKLEQAAAMALAPLAKSEWDVFSIRAAREFLRRGEVAQSNKLETSVFERTLAQIAPGDSSQMPDSPTSNEASEADADGARIVGEQSTLLRIDFDDPSSASRFELWPDSRAVVRNGRLEVSRSTGGWIIATLKVGVPDAFRLRIKGRIDGGLYLVFPAVSRDGREFPSLDAASARNESQVFFKPSELSGKALLGLVGISGVPDEALQQIEYVPSSGEDHILELTKSASVMTMSIDDGAAKLECSTPPKIVRRRGQIRFVKYVEPSGQFELDWIEVGKFQ